MPWTFLYIFYGAAGFVIMMLVATKPRLFWPLLVFGSVIGSGLMVQGYALLDEYFAAAALAGALLALGIGRVRVAQGKQDVWSQAHLFLFSLMSLYMIAESARGVLVWHDPRIARWALYYGILGALALLISLKDFFIPSLRKMVLAIGWSSLVFFGAYLAHGMWYQWSTGNSKWDLQGNVWAGPAGAAFTLVLAMLAALFLLKDRSRSRQFLAWALISLAVPVAYFYESRAAWIVILAFLLLAPLSVRFRKTIPLFLAGIAFFAWALFFTTPEFIADLTRDLNVLWQSSQLRFSSDTGRLDHSKAAFNAISRDVPTLLFGYGMHSNHYILGPYLQEIGYFGSAGIPSVVRVTGTAALLTDTGITGALLFFLNGLFVLRGILAKRNHPLRLALLLSLPLALFWLVGSNIQDMVLLYLMVMPNGLLIQLARWTEDTADQPGKLENGLPI